MRGASLGTTLVVIAVVITLALTLGAASVNHLNVTTRLENAEQAQNLAECALALGMERVLSRQGYGSTRQAGEDIQYPATGASVGRVTFRNDAGLPYSTNNLQGEAAQPGWDAQTVPAAAAHLVAVGESGGVKRTVEAILYVPRFPYVIASSGPFRSSGGLLIAGVDDPQKLADPTNLDPDKLLPGNIASNASGSEALVLGRNTRVTGDVQASGEISMQAEGVDIQGEIRPFAEPAHIPRMNVTDYDPVTLGKPEVQSLGEPILNGPALEGYVRRSGSLIVEGGLKLDGAVLYVDGDLEIHGGVQGTGALLVTGRTTIVGSSQVSTDNQLALISMGDVALSGSGKQGSYFQGLMYTEGNFTADQITLLGTFIANSQQPGGSAMTINNANLVHVPTYTSMPIESATFLVLDRSGRLQGTGKESLMERRRRGDDDDDEGRRDERWGVQVTRNPDGTYTVETSLGITTGSLDQAMAAIEAELIKVRGNKRRRGKVFVWNDRRRRKVAAFLLGMPPGKVEMSEQTTRDEFNLNPSSFLQLEERARLLLYRER